MMSLDGRHGVKTQGLKTNLQIFTRKIQVCALRAQPKLQPKLVNKGRKPECIGTKS